MPASRKEINTKARYSHSVKIINPNDKGGYRVEQLQTKYPKLTTVEQIRSELTEQLKAFVDGASCEFGYLFPGSCDISK